MFEETLYQSTPEGKPFVDVLTEQGIKPGIKVDTGLQQLPGTPGETATQGLDGLGERMRAYRKQERTPHCGEVPQCCDIHPSSLQCSCSRSWCLPSCRVANDATR